MTSHTAQPDRESGPREPWEDDLHRIAELISGYARACEDVQDAIYGRGDLAAAQAVRAPLLPELLRQVADLAQRANATETA